MSSTALASLLPLEYRDIAALHAAPLELPPMPGGVPEQEVQRRVAAAQTAATAAAEQAAAATLAQHQAAAQQQLQAALQGFLRERATYFHQLEAGVVQLAIAIARRILQRESQVDPTLLAGLVRIALDRMQTEGGVVVRVPPEEGEQWRAAAAEPGAAVRWQVEEDPSLTVGDCVLKTGLGEANFSLEVQMRDVEESVRSLLAHTPESQ